MRRVSKTCSLVLLAALAAACVNAREQTKRDIQRFMQTVSGEYVNATGDSLAIAPVYARMVGLDTIYVERTAGSGTSGRLIALEASGDGKKILQLAYGFTQQGQWRNLREQPELFSALLPKDVRPAGTCDIKLSTDLNTVTYSCGGSAPESFTRAQHGAPN